MVDRLYLCTLVVMPRVADIVRKYQVRAIIYANYSPHSPHLFTPLTANLPSFALIRWGQQRTLALSKPLYINNTFLVFGLIIALSLWPHMSNEYVKKKKKILSAPSTVAA